MGCFRVSYDLEGDLKRGPKLENYTVTGPMNAMLGPPVLVDSNYYSDNKNTYNSNYCYYNNNRIITRITTIITIIIIITLIIWYYNNSRS